MKSAGKAGNSEGLPGEPLHVEVRDGLPCRLVWRGRHYRVASVEAIWCIEGRWWLDALCTGARRRYFRVMVHEPGGGVMCLEIYRQGGLWRLWHIAD